MKLHELKQTTSRSARNRVGRGPGSGNGKTAGRGQTDRNPEVVVEFVLDLKVDRLP